MSDRTVSVYEFGPFCLDLAEQRLLRDRELVPLPPKVWDTLKVLVTHSGHVLGKDELMTAVWGDTFVEESSLSRNISLLRKALREEGDKKYIETVPKRGYRFVATVRAVEVKSGQNGSVQKHLQLTPPSRNGAEAAAALNAQTSTRKHSWRWFPVAALLLVVLALSGSYIWKLKNQRTTNSLLSTQPPITSMAVLPLKVLGNDHEYEPLGLGMADAIILRLSGSQNCRVRPTGSISKYANTELDALKAGKELGVDAVLAGTVQHVGDRVRVTAVLWGVKDGKSIWSGKFDEPFSDIFALQDSVSAQVADRLKLQLNGESPGRKRQFTTNVEAYRHYTMGYFFWSKRDKPNLAKAIQYFSQAIAEDPNYALAYSTLADTYLLDAYFGYENVPLQEAYDKAKEAAFRALQLDNTLPEAILAVGMVRMLEKDLQGAEDSFRRAIELSPSGTAARIRYAHILASTSRLDEAISEMRVAVEIDPASSMLCWALGGYLLLAGEYDESINYSRMALELDPQRLDARVNMAWAFTAQAKYQEASAEFDVLKQNRDYSGVGQAGMAYVFAKKGLLREARQLLAQTIKPIDKESGYPQDSLAIAKVLCLLGDKEEAFTWVERATESGRVSPYQLEYSAELDSLKADSRFGKLVETARNLKPKVRGIGQHA